MKCALALAILLISVQSCQAQSSSPSAFVTIDPAARDLIARLGERYGRFNSFQCIIELQTSVPVPWTYNRIRIQLRPVSGVVSVAIPGEGVEKRVFDGSTELRFNSRYPRLFQSLQMDGVTHPLRSFLRRSGVGCFTTNLIVNDKLVSGLSGLLDADLKSVSLGPIEKIDGQPLQTVIFQTGSVEHSGSLKLFIDSQNLLLRRVEGQEKVPSLAKPISISETYSQIKFDQPLPKSLFSTRAPVGFKRVTDFPNEVTPSTKPPVPQVPR